MRYVLILLMLLSVSFSTSLKNMEGNAVFDFTFEDENSEPTNFDAPRVVDKQIFEINSIIGLTPRIFYTGACQVGTNGKKVCQVEKTRCTCPQNYTATGECVSSTGVVSVPQFNGEDCAKIGNAYYASPFKCNNNNQCAAGVCASGDIPSVNDYMPYEMHPVDALTNLVSGSCVDTVEYMDGSEIFNQVVNCFNAEDIVNDGKCVHNVNCPSGTYSNGYCVDTVSTIKIYNTVGTTNNVCNDHYLNVFFNYVPSLKKMQVLYIGTSPSGVVGHNCSSENKYMLTSFSVEFDGNLPFSLNIKSYGAGCDTYEGSYDFSSVPQSATLLSEDEMIAKAKSVGVVTESASRGMAQNSSNGFYKFNVAKCSSGGAQYPTVEIKALVCPSGYIENSSGVCAKDISTVASCETGYSLLSSSGVCAKDADQKYAYYTYECPSGWENISLITGDPGCLDDTFGGCQDWSRTSPSCKKVTPCVDTSNNATITICNGTVCDMVANNKVSYCEHRACPSYDGVFEQNNRCYYEECPSGSRLDNEGKCIVD